MTALSEHMKSVFFTADRMFSGAVGRNAQKHKPPTVSYLDEHPGLKTTSRHGEDL
jgi:hypothetical protein